MFSDNRPKPGEHISAALSDYVYTVFMGEEDLDMIGKAIADKAGQEEAKASGRAERNKPFLFGNILRAWPGSRIAYPAHTVII